MGNIAHIVYIGSGTYAPVGGTVPGNTRVVTVTNNYTIQPEDGVILCDSTNNPIILTLLASLLVEENTIEIKDVGGNSEGNQITLITENQTFNIDWLNSYILNHNYLSITVRNDGENFFII